MPQLIHADTIANRVPEAAMYASAPGDEAITMPYSQMLRQNIASILKSEFLFNRARFIDARRQLDSMSFLGPNWDSYGADAPSETSRTVAARILGLLESVAFPPARIVPSAEGGVGFCFAEGDRYADIECLNSGEILGAIYRGREEPKVWELEGTEQSIKQAIQQLRVHFTA